MNVRLSGHSLASMDGPQGITVSSFVILSWFPIKSNFISSFTKRLYLHRPFNVYTRKHTVTLENKTLRYLRKNGLLLHR